MLVDVPQDWNDLQTYPQNFTENYIIAYGFMQSVGDIDADKVYDYHTLCKLDLSTATTVNVDLDMNNKKITNVSFDYDNDSIASVKMVKELSPYTRDYIIIQVNI